MKKSLPPDGAQFENQTFRAEFVFYTIAVIVSILLCGAMAILIDRLCVFDLKNAYRQATAISVVPLGDVHPEPKEKLIYLSCLLILPFGLIAAHIAFRSFLARLLTGVWLDRLYYLLFLLGIVSILWVTYAGFSAENPLHANPANAHDAIAATNYQFYLVSTFLYRHPLWYVFVIFPVISVYFGWVSFRGDTLPDAKDRLLTFSMNAFCWSCLAAILLINTFKFPYTFENRYDFSAVYYSVGQVSRGIPLLVNNFTSTYGLYPHFVAPFFKVIGLSILSFSALMALLTSFCFWLVWRFLLRNLHSRLLVFFCFTTIIFYTHFYFKLVTRFDAIFAAQPIRLLFPVLSLCLGDYFLKGKNIVRASLSLTLLAVGVLWNPEFGLITYFAFTLLIMYTCLDRPTVWTAMFSAAVRLALSAVVMATVFMMYSVVIWSLYGSFPLLGDMFQTMYVFSKLGVGMLPMPLLHPWNLVALVYIIGLVLTLKPMTHKLFSDNHARLLLITLLGIGSFSYYQGRSHNWNIVPTLLFSALLLAFFADAILARIRSEKTLVVYALLIIFVFGGSVFQIAASIPRLAELVFEEENRNGNRPEQDAILANTAYIKRNSVDGERVFILTRDYLQGLYFGLSERPAAIQPGLQELRLRSDLDRFRNFLVYNRHTKIFYAPPSGTDLDLIVESCYTVSDTNGSIALMAKRPEDVCRSRLVAVGIRYYP